MIKSLRIGTNGSKSTLTKSVTTHTCTYPRFPETLTLRKLQKRKRRSDGISPGRCSIKSMRGLRPIMKLIWTALILKRQLPYPSKRYSTLPETFSSRARIPSSSTKEITSWPYFAARTISLRSGCNQTTLTALKLLRFQILWWKIHRTSINGPISQESQIQVPWTNLRAQWTVILHLERNRRKCTRMSFLTWWKMNFN